MSTPSARRDAARLVPLLAVLAVLLTVVLTAFAWPAVNTAPRDLPVAVAGPPAATAQVAAALAAAEPGALDVRTLPDEQAARAAITDREVYGAVVVGADGPHLLVASAASPVVAQSLRQVAAGLGAASGSTVRVEDVVPTPASDPRGAGLAAAALPLALGGILTAGLVSRMIRRIPLRAAAAVAMATVGGMVTATVLGTWLGSVQSGWWTTTGVVALGMAATALVLLGLHALFREIGFALGAAVIVLLGNPLSGLTSAPELLPSGWGTLGQLLPPGATGTLLRSVSWFDGAGAGTPLLVLSTWCAAGLVLLGAGALLSSRRRPALHSVPLAVPA
ncbi:hypothetical protein [Petropleomorpha daqingensis]|uniref:ABC-2 family transporter protein n=1 Tax=Petropleomorpha daqingensis TaxID=2026353 RepID=A0A853CQU6_9ACTN|nr:hypothetical protein [Petropleomorpha daqingensis]NYJ08842.1 hypothetical protein [Petropleomorpha daqingensis]